jgi:RNA polymerase sigma-70 factor (ECF subfamily)
MDLQTDIQTLYVDHHRWLVNWLRQRLGCLDDASDLAQDTFLRVLGRPAAVAGLRKPRAWLATIAHGLMVDHVRRRDLERAFFIALADVPEPEAPSVEERVMLLDVLCRIDAMLDGLGAKVRGAFLLSRLTGLSYPEIAVQLEVSVSSVEKYMAKAYRHCLAMGHLYYSS